MTLIGRRGDFSVSKERPMAKDTFKPTPYRDPITKKQTDSFGNGKSYDISAKIAAEQRRTANPFK